MKSWYCKNCSPFKRLRIGKPRIIFSVDEKLKHTIAYSLEWNYIFYKGITCKLKTLIIHWKVK